MVLAMAIPLVCNNYSYQPGGCRPEVRFMGITWYNSGDDICDIRWFYKPSKIVIWLECSLILKSMGISWALFSQFLLSPPKMNHLGDQPGSVVLCFGTPLANPSWIIPWESMVVVGRYCRGYGINWINHIFFWDHRPWACWRWGMGSSHLAPEMRIISSRQQPYQLCWRFVALFLVPSFHLKHEIVIISMWQWCWITLMMINP